MKFQFSRQNGFHFDLKLAPLTFEMQGMTFDFPVLEHHKVSSVDLHSRLTDIDDSKGRAAAATFQCQTHLTLSKLKGKN